MKHSFKIVAILLLFFLAAQFLGLFIVSKYVDVPNTVGTGEIVHKPLPYNFQPPEVNKDYSYLYVFVAILLGTLLVFVLMKYMQLVLWKVWYFSAISFSLLLAFAAFLNQFYALIAALVFAYLKTFKPSVIVHNFTELFVYGGLATFFVWIFNVKSAFILLILISIYDAYAVWKSKHMIKLAKFQTKSQVFAGLFIPYKLGKLSKPKKGTYVKKKVKNAILGGGDIAFPIIFAGTVLESVVTYLPIQQALMKVFVIPVMATVALGLLFWKSEEKKFYPAMPFISVGCFVGYLIMILI